MSIVLMITFLSYCGYSFNTIVIIARTRPDALPSSIVLLSLLFWGDLIGAGIFKDLCSRKIERLYGPRCGQHIGWIASSWLVSDSSAVAFPSFLIPFPVLFYCVLCTVIFDLIYSSYAYYTYSITLCLLMFSF